MIIPDNILNHLASVWAGEYNIALSGERDFSILDLGANVGSFALWALHRWPKSTITCYEPHPENFELLSQNLSAFRSRVEFHESAVAEKEELYRELYLGKHNCGEGSLFKDLEQSDDSILVNVTAADRIKPHDIVKIDTEGAEVEIIRNLTFKPMAYLVEYHSTDNRVEIDRLFQNHYTLVEHKLYMLGKGVVKYIHNDILLAKP